MTAAQKNADRFRKSILISGIILTVLWAVFLILPFCNKIFGISFYGFIGTPLYVIGFFSDTYVGYFFNLMLYIGVFLLGQWAFLRPGKNFKVSIAAEGRPLKTSVFAAAFMAMLLTIGAIALILEIPNWWEGLNKKSGDMSHWYIWITMLVMWGAWAWIFHVYWKQADRYTQLGKMIRGLLAGSILEIFVAVPVHIWAARQRECYCCRGTYTTLIFAGTVLVWVFGPGVILLYMREKHRRAKLISSEPAE